MQLSALLSLAVALYVSTATAKVSIGNKYNEDGTRYNVAWLSGKNPCNDNAVLSEFPANPCNINFQLDGFTGLSLQGCGGPLYLNENGNFNSGCRGASEGYHYCGDGSHIVKSYDCAT